MYNQRELLSMIGYDEEPLRDEQDYTICPYCGEDLPHHNCQEKAEGEH